MAKPRCRECGRQTEAVHPILDVSLCRTCQRAYPDRYGFITKTRASQDYRIRPEQLAGLPVFELPNPYWKTGPRPMQLFLRRDVLDLAATRYGRAEPYVVVCSPFSADLLGQLIDNPEALADLGPERFQHFIADRLERFGLEVKIVGHVFRKDGGIDIVAYPRVTVVPFLVGVQVKHHRSRARTGVRDVRDFHGALAASQSPFHVGIFATNTTFTPDARWFAEHNQRLLRLRDLKDLQRWLRLDFVNECEWREIPKRIELAPGITVDIPRLTGQGSTYMVPPNTRLHRTAARSEDVRGRR